MLALIAVSATCLLYNFYGSSLAPQSNTAQILGNLKIVNLNVYNDSSHDYFNLTVLNNGDIAASITTVYLTNLSNCLVFVDNVNSGSAQNLAPGQTVNIYFNTSLSVACQPLTISVSASSGLVANQLYTPPTASSGQNPTGQSGNLIQTFTISGAVFNDTNMIGSYSSGYANLTYCPMELVDNTTGIVYTVQYTTISGYAFTGLNKGVYTVIAGQPPHPQGTTWLNTTPLSEVVVINSQGVSNVNFGYFLTTGSYNLTGKIYNDSNKDGVWETNEPGLSGGVIAIDNAGNFYSATTDANGNYTLLLPAGYYYAIYDYLSNSVTPQGWTNTTPWAVQEAISNCSITVNFGNYWVGTNTTSKYTITGTVFNDTLQKGGNYNSTDPSESPLNWTVMISDGLHPIQGTTAVNGVYSFSELNGTYSIIEVRQQYWQNTTPYSVNVKVAGLPVSKVDFGNCYNPPPNNIYNITGLVFNDVNETGVYNSNLDTLFSNMAVYCSINGTSNVYATTCSNGTYQFSQLTPGVYNVYMDSPISPWINTTALLKTVTITSQSVTANFSFYYAVPLNLTGFFFNDANVNGVYDQGIDNFLTSCSWALQLTCPSGAQIYSSTNSYGNYSFTGLTPGSYTLTAPQQSPWQFTTPSKVSFTITTTSVSVDFGVANLSSMPKLMAGGMAFNDTTVSGVFDNRTDNGIPYLNATFTDVLGNSYSAWTNTLGNYSSGLPAGLVAYVPITLTNSQPLAVLGFTDINIAMNWSAYSSYLDNPVDNYVFFNGNGTQLNSWLESGTSNTATNAVVWVQLDGNGIPIGGSVTIYLGFYSHGYNVLGPYNATGWNPTLSTPYAKYDNGALVFNTYDNFAGTTLSSMWSINNGTGGASGTITINNGADIKDSSGIFGIFTSINTQSTGLIAESYFNVIGVGAGIDLPALGSGMVTTADAKTFSDYMVKENNGASGTICIERESGSTTFTGTPVDGRIVAGDNDTFQEAWAPGGNISVTDLTTGISTSGIDNTYSLGSAKQAGFFVASSATGEDKLYWIRVRTMAPDNVMPTVSFGAVQTTTPSFIPLHPGLWTVQLQHSGWMNSTPDTLSFNLNYNSTTQTWSLAQSSTPNFYLTSQSLVINFGLYNVSEEPIWTIGGMVFNDTNSNGVFDGSDTGLANWVVWLFNGTYSGTSSAFIDNTTTNSAGNYSFMNLKAGTYTVIELRQSGWSNTTARASVVTIKSQSNWSVNFGNHLNTTAQPNNVTALVFDDIQENGLYNILADTNVSGNYVYLFDSFGLPIASSITNSTGQVVFAGLANGAYSVMNGMTSGWTNSTPLTVTITAPQTLNVYFGQYSTGTKAKFVIAGMKFNDTVGTGVYYNSTADPPVSNWQIWLISGNYIVGQTVPSQTATTSTTGNYSFSSLAAGSYTVMEVMTSGTNETPRYVNVTLSNNSNYAVNFGDNFGSSSGGGGTTKGSGTSYLVNGTLFNDIYGNGVYTPPGDTGLSSWTIYLCDSMGLPISSTTTSSTGTYSFSLTNGSTYTVYESVKSGYYNTSQKSFTFTVVNNNVTGKNFGDAAGDTLSGIVFNDTNSDGVFDGSDVGLASWNVYIYTGVVTNFYGVNPAYTVATSSEGNYTETLSANNYTVVESMGPSWTNTTSRVLYVNLNASMLNENFGDKVLSVVSNPTYTISGMKFYDEDQNGTYDPITDELINNFPIWIADSYGLPLNQTTTNSTGQYAFYCTNGTYYVYENPSASGYKNSTLAVQKVVVSNGPVSVSNFGNYPSSASKLFSIYGWVFNDTLDNGIYSPKVDAGLASQDVLLYTISGGKLYFNMTLTTNASGFFNVSQIPAGTYQLDMARTGVLTNYTATTPLSVNITLSTQDNVTSFGWFYNPSFSSSYTISGIVYNDTAQSGQYNSTADNLLSNVPLIITYGSNFYQTDTANGSFYFTGLNPGTYTINEVPLSGYVNSTPTQVVVTIINSSQSLKFGNYVYVAPPVYSITGFLYNDVAFPGNYSSLEDPPLSGWVMTIKNSVGSTLTDVSTNSSGNFTFSNLTAGTYTITPLPSQGSWVNGTTSPLSVTITNNSVSGLMFGYYYTGSGQGYGISGYVFNDANRNGIFDTGESGITNWYILLDNGNGTLLSAQTDANGFYSFTGLSAGTYKIENTPPEGSDAYTNTTSMIITVPLTTASVSNVNFGEFYNNFTVNGFVYLDVNNNGVYDVGTDFPLAGWMLSLTNSSGAVSYATTNSAGYYQFLNNPTTNYTLSVLPKAGWTTSASVNINLQSSCSINLNESRAFYWGLYTTFTAAGWSSNPSQLLTNYFSQVYNNTGFVQIGIPGTHGYHIEYSNISIMLTYLANTVTPLSPFTSQPTPDLNNPGTPGGEFGADVLALQLNLDYSNANAGVNPGFGSLTYYGSDSLSGSTVTQILGVANQVLGGNSTAMPSGYNLNSLDALVENLNAAFHSSDVSWAQGHLF